MSGELSVSKNVPTASDASANPVVPSGFKRTEIGLLPADWEVKALGACLTGRPSYGINAPAVMYSDRLPAYIRITDISDEGKFKPDPAVSVRANSVENYYLEEGDVVLARTGASVGKSYLYCESDGPLVFAGFLIRVRPNPGMLVPAFLSAYLRTSQYWNWVRLTSMRSGQPGINGAEFTQLPVPLPSPDEQRAIATALSDVDALLEELDRLIAKKRDIKQATMQQLLTGQTRLPEFEEEWVTVRLEDISDIRSGGTPSTTSPDLWNGGVAWCTPTDITSLQGRKYLTETERTISPKGLQVSSAEVIPPNSIIMTSRATIGECAINTIPMTTNQGFKNLIPSKVDSEFLYYLMTTQKHRLIQLCAGSTFLEIGKSQLRRFEVTLPSDIKEQISIATVLSDMDAKIVALKQRRAKTAALKQAMMQELLTGRTRLV